VSEIIYTVGQIAARYAVPAWKVRRLFERGLVPQATRVGAYRVVPASELPVIEEALRLAGYMPREAVHA
jgi:hypothetical protein